MKKHRRCSDLPQPPTDTPISLEGQNCICCYEDRDLAAKRRSLNGNTDCQSFEEMCHLFHTPLNYPPIQDASKLTYAPNPPLPVPPCQTITIPPVVPVGDRISLKDRNVLVIGGSKGIGKAIAERFATEGANVTATSRYPKSYKKPVGYKLQQVDVLFILAFYRGAAIRRSRSNQFAS